MRYGESIFDIAYLLFDLIAGVFFLVLAQGRTVFYLYGVLALILGGGDAFHLIPRVQMHLKGKNEKTAEKLGFGEAVTSITMTIFYILLLFIWKTLFPNIDVPTVIPVSIWVTALIRIVLCLFPQNKWKSSGNLTWSLYRNIPFALTGVLMIILFAISGDSNGLRMWRMCIAIALSFGFYFPVTLFAKKKPMIGALMLPKTLMYVWMLSMGLQILFAS